MLDREARTHLRTLSKENADTVARRLVAAGQVLDSDPELAYQHALAAQRRGGRVDIVREAVALAAYATGRYSEALREARTVRRLSGDESLRAIEADSERGLGRPEKALAIIDEVVIASQPAALRTELALVASGARADLGQYEAGLLVVEDALRFIRDDGMRARLLSVQADRLDDLGRSEEAAAVREQMESLIEPADDDDITYIDDTIDEELAAALALEEQGTAEEYFELAPVPPGEDPAEREAGQSAPSAPSPASPDEAGEDTEDEPLDDAPQGEQAPDGETTGQDADFPDGDDEEDA